MDRFLFLASDQCELFTSGLRLQVFFFPLFWALLFRSYIPNMVMFKHVVVLK